MQEVAGLNFYLWHLNRSGDFFQDLGLTIYAKQEFIWQDKKIVLAIVGESHFMLIEGYLMELLACTNLPEVLPKGMVLRQKATAQSLHNYSFNQVTHKLIYKVKARIVPYGQTNDLAVEGEVLVRLNEEFPFKHQGKEFACATKVLLAAENAQTLRLKTSHDYPFPDQQTVITESSIFFKEPTE